MEQPSGPESVNGMDLLTEARTAPRYLVEYGDGSDEIISLADLERIDVDD